MFAKGEEIDIVLTKLGLHQKTRKDAQEKYYFWQLERYKKVLYFTFWVHCLKKRISPCKEPEEPAEEEAEERVAWQLIDTVNSFYL